MAGKWIKDLSSDASVQDSGTSRDDRVSSPADPSTPDAALVADARDGDARAFEALLGRHEARVLRVLRLLGVPAQDREDVAQEVFFRIFRGLDGFRPSFPFASWVYRVTVNAAHDFRARRRRQARDEVPWDDDTAARAVHESPGPETATVRRDLRERLERALAVLTERERAVFVLREMEEVETAEVARLLGITRITVRRHLGLARVRLGRVLLDPERKISRR